MIFWKITLRELLNRPGRAIFTLMGIVVAVTSVVAVRITAVTMEQSYQRMYESLTGLTDLEIVVEGGGVFSQQVLDRLKPVNGIRVASPIFQQPTNLFYEGSETPVPVLLFGIEPIDYQVRKYTLDSGTPIENASGMLLENIYAQNLKIKPGDQVRIFTRRGLQPIEVGDTVSLGDAKSAAQIGLAVLPLDAVQYYFQKPDRLNRIDLILAPGVDPYQKLAEIAEILPQECTVQIPPIRLQMSRSTVESAEQGLRFAYAITLMLAAVMILNTFMMNVSERRKQIAVLRALGTTRRQIITMFLREGCLLGITGSIIGCGLGAWAAGALTGAMGSLYQVNMPEIYITWEPFVVALICGPGLAIFSAWLPARIAGSVTPLEGMRPAVQSEDSPLPKKTVMVGLIGLTLTTLGLIGCIVEILPGDFAIPVGCGFILSLIMTVPIILVPASKLLGRGMRLIFGREVHVAERMVLRRRTRTTLTIGVLYIAIGGSVGLGTAILNNVDEVRHWQTIAYSGDYFVHATELGRIGDRTVAVPESVVKEVATLPGVTSTQRLSILTSVQIASRTMHMVIEEILPERPLPFMLKSGDEHSVRKGLAEGGVVIGETAAHRLKLKLGDTIPVECREGIVDLKIVGVTVDFIAGGMTAHTGWPTGSKLFNIEDPDFLVVMAQPEQREAVGKTLDVMCKDKGVSVTSFAGIQRQFESVITGIVAGLWGVIALSFIVAAFGVANTLTMNVLEQTRDLALLRVIAMTRHQVRKTVLAQAALLGAIGIGLGLAGGLLGAYTTNLCLPAVLGYSIDFRWRPDLIIGTAVIGFTFVLLAAWIPAIRASRLNLLIALHYE